MFGRYVEATPDKPNLLTTPASDDLIAYEEL